MKSSGRCNACFADASFLPPRSYSGVASWNTGCSYIICGTVVSLHCLVENIRRTTDWPLAFVAGRLRAIKRLKSASRVDGRYRKPTEAYRKKINAGKEAGPLRKRERPSVTGEKERAKRKRPDEKEKKKGVTRSANVTDECLVNLRLHSFPSPLNGFAYTSLWVSSTLPAPFPPADLPRSPLILLFLLHARSLLMSVLRTDFRSESPP